MPLTPTRRPPKWSKKKIEQYLLNKGVITRKCLGLEGLLGPVSGPVNMEEVLEIGRKLTGMSQQIIADREDRI